WLTPGKRCVIIHDLINVLSEHYIISKLSARKTGLQYIFICKTNIKIPPGGIIEENSVTVGRNYNGYREVQVLCAQSISIRRTVIQIKPVTSAIHRYGPFTGAKELFAICELEPESAVISLRKVATGFHSYLLAQLIIKFIALN